MCLKLVDPIESRCKDDEFRAQAARDLLKSIDDCRMAAKSLSAPERDAVSYFIFTVSQVAYLSTPSILLFVLLGQAS